MRISKEIIHQSLACTPVIFNQFLIGVGWGWISPTLLKLQSDDSEFKITTKEAAWLGSISEFGRIFGPCVTPLLLDNLGRKTSSLLMALVTILIWAVTIFVRDIYVLLATRIIFGIANGVTDVTSAIYITEICSPHLRAIGGGAIEITFFAGLIFEFVLASYVSYTNAAIVNTVLAICAISSQYFSVETTYFLIMKGKYEQSRKNLMWLQPNSDVEHELKEIQKNVEEQQKKRQSIKRLFSSVTNLKAMFASIGFQLLYSSVGFHTVTPYASLIFAPSSVFTSNEYTVLFGVAQFLTGICSVCIVEKVGRRPLLLCCFTIIICCNACTSALLYFHGKNYDIPLYPWLLFLNITLYSSAGAFMSPIVYIITGELLPLSVRAIGGSLAISASSIGSFTTAILFWPITKSYGMETNFIIFTFISILTANFIYMNLPETRGKSLHEMHKKPTTEEVDNSQIEVDVVISSNK